jgi:hypothetical protein
LRGRDGAPGRSAASGASTGAGGAELAQLISAPRRDTERSGVALALETKFLLFDVGQERDSVLSA